MIVYDICKTGKIISGCLFVLFPIPFVSSLESSERDTRLQEIFSLFLLAELGGQFLDT